MSGGENTFSAFTNAIPDFTHYYTGFSDPSTWGNGGISIVHTTPTIIGGRPAVIFTMFKSAPEMGKPSLVATPCIEIILQQQMDGKFVDVTGQLLNNVSIENGFRLNGASANVVAELLGDSTNPLIVIAQNNDDGRNNSNTDGSGNLAVAQAHIPQDDGTYLTVNLGYPAFGDQGSVKIVEDAQGALILLAGYTSANGPRSTFNVSLSGNQTADIPLTQAFRYDPVTKSLSTASATVGNQAGYAVIDESTVVTQVEFHSGGTSTTKVSLVSQHGPSNFTIDQILSPYQFKTIDNFVSWTGAKGTANVYDVDGNLVIGFFKAVGTLESIPGKTPPIVITSLAGQNVGAPHADGNYYEGDSSPFASFQFWEYQNGQLKPSALHLVDANPDTNAGEIQLLDIDRNGLTDLVVNNWNDTGQPDVYLNDGAGDLIHVPLSTFPVFDADYHANATFIDLGSQKWGLLYQKQGVDSYNYRRATPELYVQDQAIQLTRDVEILNRNKGSKIGTWAGNDLISDSNAVASTYINAGEGLDTCVYSDVMVNYAISNGEDRLTSVTHTKANGFTNVTDTLDQVERLRFSDKNVALDLEMWDHAGSAYRLYKAAFDRPAEADGLGYWISMLDDGVSLQTAAYGFLLSDEFKRLYGDHVSDTAFVTKLYNNVLDRNPDQGGLDYWLYQLGHGTSREDALIYFSESQENMDNVADLIANGIQYQPWLL